MLHLLQRTSNPLYISITIGVSHQEAGLVVSHRVELKSGTLQWPYIQLFTNVDECLVFMQGHRLVPCGHGLRWGHVHGDNILIIRESQIMFAFLPLSLLQSLKVRKEKGFFLDTKALQQCCSLHSFLGRC